VANNKWLNHPIVVCASLGLVSFLLIIGLQSLDIVEGLELRVFDKFLSERPSEFGND